MKGNLIDLAEQGHFNVIVHGCNCFHTMGAGIAKEIKQRYPQAYEVDCIHTEKGDQRKLGNFTWQRVVGPIGHEFIIVNAYTQFHYGRKGCLMDYTAMQKVFERIGDRYSNATIGYPRIGAGLGGGDWDIIQKIIDFGLSKVKAHHLVELN
jgi:O-acetyl-ADP-ribose deacetylase (regulator of RNase III)